MKTTISFYNKDLGMIFMIIFPLLCVISAKSQTSTHLAKTAGTIYSEIIQYDNLNRAYLGIGPDFHCIPPCTLSYKPSAKLHIRESFTSFPLFKIESSTSGDSLVFLYRNSNTNTSYGIHQYGFGLSNYFEGSIGTHSNFSFDASEPRVSIATHTNGLQFQFTSTIPPGLPVTTLRVKDNGIKVDDLMECNKFKLNDNPADRYVLVSDQDGNGTWTDASIFNDSDWLVETVLQGGKAAVVQNLYTNPIYQNVGIGTIDPQSKLHVMDGNILISRSPQKSKAPHSKNGSILFGDVITSNCPTGEWGIEYNTEFDEYNSNGLNFWKPYTDDHHDASGNYFLYLRNDGTVGIGTNDTKGYKLAVNGTIICTELKCKLYADWPDYVLNKKYSLPSLAKVERFIDKNNHLPGVPSAKELKENGLNVGEMNAVLLQKIEELTLYMISMNKEIEQLKSELANKK
jgi:hypothetical protein